MPLVVQPQADPLIPADNLYELPEPPLTTLHWGQRALLSTMRYRADLTLGPVLSVVYGVSLISAGFPVHAERWTGVQECSTYRWGGKCFDGELARGRGSVSALLKSCGILIGSTSGSGHFPRYEHSSILVS